MIAKEHTTIEGAAASLGQIVEVHAVMRRGLSASAGLANAVRRCRADDPQDSAVAR